MQSSTAQLFYYTLAFAAQRMLLPAIIANLQGRGFHLVTISKLLETAPIPQSKP
jgi:hypothetical protein